MEVQEVKIALSLMTEGLACSISLGMNLSGINSGFPKSSKPRPDKISVAIEVFEAHSWHELYEVLEPPILHKLKCLVIGTLLVFDPEEAPAVMRAGVIVELELSQDLLVQASSTFHIITSLVASSDHSFNGRGTFSIR